MCSPVLPGPRGNERRDGGLVWQRRGARKGKAVQSQAAPKDLIFNGGDGAALKRLQAGVDKLASVLGITLGPKGRNVVLESKYGAPKIVNDGVTVAKEVELEDSVENVGCKLVRQAAQRTNDTAGDGTTTATVLSAAMIAEGMRIIMSGTNPVQLTRGMERTSTALMEQLKTMTREVKDDEIANVASVSAGNNEEIGKMVSDAMDKVGRQGVITLEEARSVENSLRVVEGMQFDRGYISPYFVTDSERMTCEFDNAKLLLVDKKISTARDMVGILEDAIKNSYPLVILAEEIEQEALATLVVNRLRGTLKVSAIKAPGFGDRRTQYLEDIAVLTGGTVVKDEIGIQLDKAGPEVLGDAARVEMNKETTTIVGRGGTQDAVDARVNQINNLVEQAESEYEKEKLNDRIAKLAGGVAIIQVGAQTETELREKKLRTEDALNATKAAVQEGIVIGGGCTLLKLTQKVESIKEQLENEEQRIGAEIIKRALSYPLRLIAQNAGHNGSVVAQHVSALEDPNQGFNAATGEYEDLMEAGIIDPAKVIRACLENASSVARTFIMSDAVVTEIPQPEDPQSAPNVDNSGYPL